MSRTHIPRTLRALAAEDEKHRWAYCQSAVAIVGMPFEIDHVIPESLGGLTVRENLCLCCSPCNERKACRTTAIDPLTGDRAAHQQHSRRRGNSHSACPTDLSNGCTVSDTFTLDARGLHSTFGRVRNDEPARLDRLQTHPLTIVGDGDVPDSIGED